MERDLRRIVPDYYSVLGVTSGASMHEIRQVGRERMKLFHPRNSETGNHDQFRLVREAFRVLTDPILRTEFDSWHGREEPVEDEVPEQKDTSISDVGDDLTLGRELLMLLYQARRRDVNKPGLGVMMMEQTLGCTERALDFHIWYLKEKGWAQRTEGGTYAITVLGVDQVTAEIASKSRESASDAD